MTFYILDVFGNKRYSGNQLAVFMDSGRLNETEMQQIAREINFSETTFITSPDKTNGGYPVRIFTPGSEVAFAGHPTLGTAYILQKYIENGQSNSVSLNLKAGQIPVTTTGDLLWMKQNQPEFGDTVDADMMASMLKLKPGDINTRFPVQEVSTGLHFLIVPLTSLDAVKRSGINHEIYWKFIENSRAKGILVFSTEGREKGHGISSRVYVDYYGIPEDPATGSATGCLAAYLVNYSVFGSTQIEVTAGQGYEMGRPSELYIRAEKKHDEYDIFVGGKVFEVASGIWNANNNQHTL
ncbi:MAG TPA: PhzF family phenazine biosynthesis protein [Bacteroidales bacterium]|nr:PhzF family phenazine biosynthesis protein [Bacteroidales bacterium]